MYGFGIGSAMTRDRGRSSRRHLLKTIPTTLTTLGLAGCLDTSTNPFSDQQDDPHYDDPDTPSGDDTDDDGPINKRPDTPAAKVLYPAEKLDTYTFFDLPQFNDITPPQVLNHRRGWAIMQTYDHPDTNCISIEMSKRTATATITNLKLARELNLTLHVRTNASLHTYLTTHTTLTPKEDGGDTNYSDYTNEFDISDIPQPKNKSGFVKLTATDPIAETTRSLKRHQYIVFDTPDGTHWVNNNGNFNLHHYHNERKTPYVETPNNIGYYDYDDSSTEYRRIYMATRNNINGELIAGTTTINNGTYRKFATNEGYRRSHDLAYESHFADQISHINTLGASILDSQEFAELTETPYTQLSSLADLIQHMPYGSPRFKFNDNPTTTLYQLTANCTEKTAIFGSITRSNTWAGEYRTAAIYCKLKGGQHFVIGLDERDFTPPDKSKVFYVRPQDENLPDTRYAFLELTTDAEIGEFNEDFTEIEYVYDTMAFNNKNDYSQEPPDY